MLRVLSLYSKRNDPINSNLSVYNIDTFPGCFDTFTKLFTKRGNFIVTTRSKASTLLCHWHVASLGDYIVDAFTLKLR